MTFLAGGASSPVRAGAAVGGAPFVQASGKGAYAYDRSGRAFVDYVMGYGPLLFGHAHPKFTVGLDELAARGTLFGSTHDEEERLAARIAEHLPFMERSRFTSTGTEAVMSVFRVARAFTHRPLILRFAGNYHGHFDGVLYGAGASALTGSDVARSGIPADARAGTLVARYNDLRDVDDKLALRAGEIAAIVVEPVVGNMGLVEPDPGFLEGIAQRARVHGALLIFDEVITWLRLGLGGGAAYTGIEPDLCAIGKIMGGGFPLGAFGGRAAIMAALAPQGGAFTGGTFSGNPFSIALGHRTLDAIEADPGLYARLNASAQTLAGGFRALFARREIPFEVAQLASMVDFKFRAGPRVRNFDQANEADRAAFAAYYHLMRERGVLLAPSCNELMFLSTEHGPSEIALTLEAAERAFDILLEKKLVPQTRSALR